MRNFEFGFLITHTKFLNGRYLDVSCNSDIDYLTTLSLYVSCNRFQSSLIITDGAKSSCRYGSPEISSQDRNNLRFPDQTPYPWPI